MALHGRRYSHHVPRGESAGFRRQMCVLDPSFNLRMLIWPLQPLNGATTPATPTLPNSPNLPYTRSHVCITQAVAIEPELYPGFYMDVTQGGCEPEWTKKSDICCDFSLFILCAILAPSIYKTRRFHQSRNNEITEGSLHEKCVPKLNCNETAS